MKRITIEPVSRIEGHATVTIELDDSGRVAGTQFHVTQIRGFEKFTEGRPYYEMPGITARICGICPISHQLASSKACDAIMAVRIPPAGRLLRELLHCAQFVQSHALSFFYLSAPDLLLGMDSDPAKRNILGVIEKSPEVARDGIELRKFGLRCIEALAGERVHPAWVVPGGVAAPMSTGVRDRILGELPRAVDVADRTLQMFKDKLDGFADEIAHFGSAPTMCAGMVGSDGELQLYDGRLRFTTAAGEVLADAIEAERYGDWIAEAALRDSYLKAPYFKPAGFPDGAYRVGPLARLNVCNRAGAAKADAELELFRARFGRPAHSSFLYHYARLIEIVYALERMRNLLENPQSVDAHVRATAGVNSLEGVGMIEAPRGVLIHHYKVDEQGAMVWANLIVATGHNNLAISHSIRQVSERYVHGEKIEEGALNRISAVIRAYDPCLSCSTHADGLIPLRVRLVGPRGTLLHELAAD